MSTVLVDVGNVVVLVWLCFVARWGWRNGVRLLHRVRPGGRHVRPADAAPARPNYALWLESDPVEPAEQFGEHDLRGATVEHETWRRGEEMPADPRADDGIRVHS